MKTYYVKVSHKEATKNLYYSVTVEDYFTKDALASIFSNVTKYKVKVYDQFHFKTFFKDICKESEGKSIFDVVIPYFGIKPLVECIKKACLYKVVRTPIYKTVESHEIRLFKLSACFKIKDVSQNSKGDITFFKVVKNPEDIKDVEFIDDDLKKSLHCKQAVNGYYYMYGVWNFFRNKSYPVHCAAKKSIVNRILSDYKEEKVLL
jgi:hypothetical protein